jgi:hypothetical protein
MFDKLTVLRNLRKRKERQAVKDFEGLIAVPHNFTNPLVMPANAKLFVSLGAEVVAPVLVCTAGDRDMYAGPIAANVMQPLGYFEEGVTLTAVYAARTIRLYLSAPMGERPLIAQKIVP